MLCILFLQQFSCTVLIAGNYRGKLLRIDEKYDFHWENFCRFLAFATQKMPHPQILWKKTFANSHKICESFSLESFPLYGILILKQVALETILFFPLLLHFSPSLITLFFPILPPFFLLPLLLPFFHLYICTLLLLYLFSQTYCVEKTLYISDQDKRKHFQLACKVSSSVGYTLVYVSSYIGQFILPIKSTCNLQQVGETRLVIYVAVSHRNRRLFCLVFWLLNFQEGGAHTHSVDISDIDASMKRVWAPLLAEVQ